MSAGGVAGAQADIAALIESRLETHPHDLNVQYHRAAIAAGRRNWEAVIPFFAFSVEVRKAVRNKGHFPSDQAAMKLIWLALRNVTQGWKNAAVSWHAAKTQLAIQIPRAIRVERVSQSLSPAHTRNF